MRFSTTVILLLVFSSGCFSQTRPLMEMAPNPALGAGKTVMLDDYFNHQLKKDDNGRTIAWHYKWDESDNGGYSIWGKVFNSFGATTATLSAKPTLANLSRASVYIVVDPRVDKDSTPPKPKDAEVIADWVKKGGVLALMANDLPNCDLEHFNLIAAKFGIQFNMDSVNSVEGNKFEQGRVIVSGPNEILKTAKTLYLKDISTLRLPPPAKPLLIHNGNVIMATAKYGKGWVFVVGDPWLYNEYIDGRKLPADYDNFKAAQDLSRWLLDHANGK